MGGLNGPAPRKKIETPGTQEQENDAKTPDGRIALTLMFDGAPFCGWQVQKNAVSVQSVLQDALERVLGFRTDVCGCSRTDAGVHAKEFVCHISAHGVGIDRSKLPAALNFYLPDAVRVKKAQDRDADFHARYSCLAKEYVYMIWNAPFSNPFLRGKALFYPKEIDVDALLSAEQEFCGTHDYSAFCSAGSSVRDTVRTVYYFHAVRRASLVLLFVCADGFLYNMVRIMAGTYLNAAMGKYTPGDIAAIIAAGGRQRAGSTLPAHGLYLNRVFYDRVPDAPGPWMDP